MRDILGNIKWKLILMNLFCKTILSHKKKRIVFSFELEKNKYFLRMNDSNGITE